MPRTRRLHPQEMLKIAEANHPPAATSPDEPENRASVTIVVLSLDRVHLTRRCVESIYAHSNYPFDLLIWDNGSRPETIAYLREIESTYDNLSVIYHETNLGWAEGRNRAFAQATTDYVFSLDNDTICHPGWLSETMACARRREAEFVAPMRLDTRGMVWALGAELVRTEEGSVLEIARWFHDLPPATVQALFRGGDLASNFLSGGIGLFAVDAFHSCGGFRECFRAGFEDMDFSLRLTERGYGVWATPQAVVTHDDAWRPEAPADVDYVLSRYDMATLKRGAARFKSIWGFEVLPEKYVRAFETRLQRKLESKE